LGHIPLQSDRSGDVLIGPSFIAAHVPNRSVSVHRL
jgi:hypothetical protein